MYWPFFLNLLNLDLNLINTKNINNENPSNQASINEA